MKKTSKYLILSFKKKITSWGYILTLLLMLCSLVLIAQFQKQTSSGNSTTVGVFIGDSTYAETAIDTLLQNDTPYTLKSYPQEDLLQRDVAAGRITCAVIFNEDFDYNFKHNHLVNQITLLATPADHLSALVQEDIYATLFSLYSPKILQKGLEKISPEMTDIQMQDAASYLAWAKENYRLFDVKIQYLSFEATAETANDSKVYTLPEDSVLRVCLLFFFILMYLALAEKWNPLNMVAQNLTCFEKLQFSIMDVLSSTIIPVLCYLVLIFLTPDTKIGTALLRLFILIVYGSVWCCALGLLLHKRSQFLGSIPVILLANLVLCPIFYYPENYIPALKFLKYLLPLGAALY